MSKAVLLIVFGLVVLGAGIAMPEENTQTTTTCSPAVNPDGYTCDEQTWESSEENELKTPILVSGVVALGIGVVFAIGDGGNARRRTNYQQQNRPPNNQQRQQQGQQQGQQQNQHRRQ